MKKLLFALLCVALLSCKKEENSPAKVASNEISSVDYDGQAIYNYTWANGRATSIDCPSQNIHIVFSVENSYLIALYSGVTTERDTLGKVNSDGDLYVTYTYSSDNNIEVWDTTTISYNSNRIVSGIVSKSKTTNHTTSTTVSQQYSTTYTIVSDAVTAYSYTSNKPSDLSGSGAFQYYDTSDAVGTFNVLDFYKGVPIESGASAFASAYGSYCGYLGKQLPKLIKNDGSNAYTYTFDGDRVKTATQTAGSTVFYRTFNY